MWKEPEVIARTQGGLSKSQGFQVEKLVRKGGWEGRRIPKRVNVGRQEC